MCGIAGFTHISGGPRAGLIQRITTALKHRGPDQQGVWESADVSLGAVRLKILDLELGDQPMVCPKSGTVLAFNGEIYNHLELRRELEAKGHRFRSHCDTETILAAFVEWDTQAFEKLRGMFAAAFWSPKRRRLVLVRDRMGIKPLYFSRRGVNLRFGSEMKALLMHPGVSREIDPAGLAAYLSCNYVPGTHTLVDGIEKLPPGTWLDWEAGRITSGTYWRLTMQPDSSITLDAAKEELDDLLRKAVQEHLLTDVPLGVWSSGGLDSSTILHYASESRKLKTFSVSFPGRKFDESSFFREMSQVYGTEHHEFALNPDSELPGVVEQLVEYSDEPSADAGAVPVWFLSKMCRSEVTVALSGDGADELFGGYNTYLADRYAGYLRHLPSGFLKMAASAAGGLPVSDEKIGLDYKINRMLHGASLTSSEAHFFWNGTFSREQQVAMMKKGWAMPKGSPVPEVPGRSKDGLNNFLWADQLNYLPDDILNKCDRMSMAHSLEVRPPFLDHRIVEFASRLPLDLKIRGSKLKFVLRELMKDRLPKSVTSRPKEGFDIPAHHWLRTTLRPLLLDTLTEEKVTRSGLFRWSAIESLVTSHLERRANVGYHLWGLLILFLWMDRWKISAAGIDLGAPAGVIRA